MEGIKDLWEGLQKARKPIVIYGMGDGCDKILKICEKKGIPIRGIFASDDHVRKKTVHGFPLKSLQEIKAEWGEVIALLAFGAFRKELMDHILFVAKETELYAPEVPLFGGGLFDRAYFCENEEKIETVRSFLSDEASRRVFQNLLDFKLFGTVDSLIEIQSEREEDLKTLVPFRPGDCYLDLGAYDGDTVLEWAEMHPDYGTITAFEPNPKSFGKMQKNCAHLQSFFPLPYAAWNQNDILKFRGKTGRSASIGLDGDFTVEARRPDESTERIDFIKMDVEGAEKEAIEGCRRLIEKQKPTLCISAYHRTEDLFAIPLLVKEICPEYRVYLRHTPYVPAWDSFYYFSCR